MSAEAARLACAQQRHWLTLLPLVEKKIVRESGRDTADFHAAQWLENYLHHAVPALGTAMSQ